MQHVCAACLHSISAQHVCTACLCINSFWRFPLWGSWAYGALGGRGLCETASREGAQHVRRETAAPPSMSTSIEQLGGDDLAMAGVCSRIGGHVTQQPPTPRTAGQCWLRGPRPHPMHVVGEGGGIRRPTPAWTHTRPTDGRPGRRRDAQGACDG